MGLGDVQARALVTGPAGSKCGGDLEGDQVVARNVEDDLWTEMLWVDDARARALGTGPAGRGDLQAVVVQEGAGTG